MKIARRALLATALASLAIVPAAIPAAASAEAPPLLIPAPSFSYLCEGGTGYLLFNDGRLYDCRRQGFLVFLN